MNLGDFFTCLWRLKNLATLFGSRQTTSCRHAGVSWEHGQAFEESCGLERVLVWLAPDQAYGISHQLVTGWWLRYVTSHFTQSPVGLPLTPISFLLEYSLIPEVLLIQAASDEEGMEGQCSWGTNGQGLEKAPLYMYVFRSVSMLASGQMKSRSPEFPSTGNGYLQPEIESNEYSNTHSSPNRQLGRWHMATMALRWVRDWLTM